MYKKQFQKREVIKFKQFKRKGYSLFACLGREVIIGTLSVATLTYAKADGISTNTEKADTTLMKTSKEVTLEDIEVTSSRAPLTLGQAARMVTVLDREQIAQAPVQSINDLLKYARGVDVRQRCPIGAQTDISTRGGTSEQITILLNGINICDPQTGHNAFDFPVDISEIERIELLEGPAGRVYGTSSLVGAINIVTRPASESSTDFHVEGGSFGYLSAGARANAVTGKWNNQLSGSYTRSDGFTRAQAGNLNGDYKGGKFFYQGQYKDRDVLMNWYAGMSSKDWGSSTSYATPTWKADNQYECTDKYYAGLRMEAKSGIFHFRPSIYWNQSRDQYEGYRGQPEKMKYNYNRTNVYGANINSFFDWMAGRTAFGAEFRNEDLKSGNLGEPLHHPVHISRTERDYTLGLNRTNLSFHLEHSILLQRFTLSAGFVAVKNTWNEMAFKLYPGIDMSYRIDNHWKVYASFNSSLRMPSFTELYYSKGGHKADKYLKPEEMNAIEGGIKYLSSGFQAQMAVYHHHGKNMIDWIMDMSKGDDAVWESVNHTKVNTIGIDIDADLNFAHLIPSQQFLKKLDVTYCYINQDKEQKADILSQYALEYLRHKLVVGVQMHLYDKLNLGVNYRFQERIGSYTTFDNEVKSYSPYAIWDARLSWDAPSYTLYAQANNIFDKKYVDYGLVPQPGTWIVVGAKLHLTL